MDTTILLQKKRFKCHFVVQAFKDILISWIFAVKVCEPLNWSIYLLIFKKI